MMAIYAPDAKELLPHMPALIGREAIRAFYRSLMDRFPRFRHEFEPQEIIVANSGDVAVVRGTYQFRADTARSDQTQTGKFVGVWRHRDDDWRLLMNISNADRAP